MGEIFGEDFLAGGFVPVGGVAFKSYVERFEAAFDEGCGYIGG